MRALFLCFLAGLVRQHGPVEHLVLFQLLDGFVGLGHGEQLGCGLDAVTSGHIQHFAEPEGAADRASADGALAGDERKSVYAYRRWGHAHKAQRSCRPQRLQIYSPVLVSVCGVQNKIHGPGYFLHGLGFAAVDKVVRAECASFLFLAGRGGEGRDFCAENAGKLDGNVSQSTDSNNADPRRRVNAMDAKRIVDRDAAAEQWRRLFAVKAIGNGNYEACIGTNAFGVTAVAMNTCSFGIGAKVLQAPHAPFALTAGIRLPPETDSLAYLEGSCLTAHGSNSPDNLVTRNERKMADAPIVGDKVKIAVADATVSNGDLNLLRTQLSWIIVEGQ